MIRLDSKPDAEGFRSRLASLRRARLGARRWWPHYLFHFADLQNVVSILTSGELLSRGAVAARHPDFSDSASPEIIEQTDEHWKHYVRFYFRPRTPTLYRNEGFRPRERRPLGGAHCPAPVFLLFDLEEVICRADSLFSYGSLARPDVEVYSSASDFEQLPFDLVYHDSRFEKEARDDIIFHRHAEVIVPDRIGLESLRLIWCRSAAEFETLRWQLPADVWAHWRDRIGVRTDYNLFNREWIYVENVWLGSQSIRFHFNPSRSLMDAGPFDLCLEVTDPAGQTWSWTQKDAEIGSRLDVDLSDPGSPSEYHVRLLLDENLAYAGRYAAADSLL